MTRTKRNNYYLLCFVSVIKGACITFATDFRFFFSLPLLNARLDMFKRQMHSYDGKQIEISVVWYRKLAIRARTKKTSNVVRTYVMHVCMCVCERESVCFFFKLRFFFRQYNFFFLYTHTMFHHTLVSLRVQIHFIQHEFYFSRLWSQHISVKITKIRLPIVILSI